MKNLIFILQIINTCIFLLCIFFGVYTGITSYRKYNKLLHRIKTLELWVILNDRKINPFGKSNFVSNNKPNE